MTEKIRGLPILTVEQVATIVQKTSRFVQLLVKDGYIVQQKRGEYTLIETIRGLQAYYEDRLSRSEKKATANRASEARTKQIEQQMEIRQRNLVPRSDFYVAQDYVVSELRAAFAGLPARLTRDIPERRKIEKAIDQAFSKTAERIERAAHALEAGGAVLDALGETNAGPVGEEE